MALPTAERLRELMERLRRNQEEMEIVKRLRARKKLIEARLEQLRRELEDSEDDEDESDIENEQLKHQSYM